MLIMMVVFLILGGVMGWVIYRLPVICGLLWWLSSVWGILAIGTTILIMYPQSWPYIWRMALLFLAALPGIMIANFEQLKRLALILKQARIDGKPITKATAGHKIFINETDSNDTCSITHIHGCTREYVDAARKRAHSYRREYR